MAAKLKLDEIALQQENIEIDGIEYMLTAWPATYALDFMDKFQDQLSEGKADMSLVKKVITSSVSKDNKMITKDSFDFIFSRKFAHMMRVYEEALKYNLDDPFPQPDSEE